MRRIATSVCSACAALCAAAADVTLEADGSLAFPGGRKMEPRVFLSDWRFPLPKRVYETVREGLAAFPLCDGDKVVADVEATLEQAPGGKVRAKYSVTPREDLPVHGVCAALTLPAAEAEGRRRRRNAWPCA